MSAYLDESSDKAPGTAGLDSIAEAVAATHRILESEGGCAPALERRIERFLCECGEQGVEHYIATFIESSSDLRVECRSPFPMPDIAVGDIATPCVSRAENGELFSIPATLCQYQEERLRLLAKTAVQRALGRKVVVSVGIGFIGTANIAAAANARSKGGAPAYFVIGYQRPSTHSSWKVDFMNRGLPTITTDDSVLSEMIEASVQRGNLTATFLQPQSLAVADLVFVETELHVRKSVARAIERAETAPEATLQLLEQIASVMQAHALLVIESTVYPGFTRNDALPVVNRVLRERGLLNKNDDANLAYGFHRVKPGHEFMQLFMDLPRDAGGTTPVAVAMLREYYETSGIRYRMHEDITTSELMKDVENAAKYGVLDLNEA